MNIDARNLSRDRRIALFDLGFRPFFLFAGVASLLLMALWIYAYAQQDRLEFGYYSAVTWHSHEMIFGYAGAVIAGFLLTAVRNWTGVQTTTGNALAGLVALWVAGRIAPLFAGALPHWVIAAVDTAFIPALALALSVPLLRRGQKHNLVFLFVLTALTAANIMVHLQILGLTQTTASQGMYFAVYVIVFLIAIISGRVIPFFTETGMAGATTRQWKPVEYIALGALIALMLLDLMGAAPWAVMVAALITAIAHSIRLAGWYNRGLWSVPLLWVLHLGYAWLIAGFVLKALSAAGLVNPMLALHAFTAAGIGTMTLGMMARVSQGHTGRALRVGPVMTWAFVIANLAGVSRVFLPILVPGMYSNWVVLAGTLWGIAFAIFVISYAGILIQPRVDGRPG